MVPLVVAHFKTQTAFGQARFGRLEQIGRTWPVKSCSVHVVEKTQNAEFAVRYFRFQVQQLLKHGLVHGQKV